MRLNLTNLKDLEHICGLAVSCLENFGLELEDIWLGRARLYRDLFRAEIAQWDAPQPFPEVVADPGRKHHPLSGIWVRARYPDGGYGTTDLAHLTKESFFAWLRSRGGKNEWAENTVAALLGYDVE